MVYEITSSPYYTQIGQNCIQFFDLSECNRLFKIGYSKRGQEKSWLIDGL